MIVFGAAFLIVVIYTAFDNLDRVETNAKAESFDLKDKIAAMRGVIPADLQGELRGCIDAVKP